MKFFKRKKKANGDGMEGADVSCEQDAQEELTCKEMVQRETAAVLHKAGTVMDNLSHGRLRVRLPKAAK